MTFLRCLQFDLTNVQYHCLIIDVFGEMSNYMYCTFARDVLDLLIFTGCEDIIKVHFTMQKDAVLKQCSEWLRQAVSPEQERRLRKAVDELRIQLDKIE